MSVSYPPPPPPAMPPPPAVYYAPAAPPSPHYAGFWRRLFALLVDGLLFGMIYGVVAFVGRWGISTALGTVVFDSPTGPTQLLSRADLALSGLLA